MPKPMTVQTATPQEITIGMKATEYFNGDSYPYEVADINSDKEIVLRALDFSIDPNSKEELGIGFAENPSNFIYTHNPNGRRVLCRLKTKKTPNGGSWAQWETECFQVIFGVAHFTRNPII